MPYTDSQRQAGKKWRQGPKGKAWAKKWRESVLGMEAKIRNLERRIERQKVVDTLYTGRYDTQEMYESIKDYFPDHTDSVIMGLLRKYPSKRRLQPSADEFTDSRGIIIPVTGTFPEYPEEYQ